MFYISKAFQAVGLIIISIDFFRKFPNLMSPRILGLGLIIFLMGWLIQRFMLKS